MTACQRAFSSRLGSQEPGSRGQVMQKTSRAGLRKGQQQEQAHAAEWVSTQVEWHGPKTPWLRASE
jgi:hypothetical protein